MIKYIGTAAALKCFSLTPFTRSLYRRVGNLVGGKRRRTTLMPRYYVDRLRRMLQLQRQYSILRDGDRILELGTGWLHWEAISLRLFFDIKAILFDVWDNRQLGGLKNYVRQLDGMLDDGFGLNAIELSRAHSLITAILKVGSFDELYDLLGFEYCVESSGSLSQFPENSFQLVVSAGVLEHVKREAAPILISETQRVLQPSGWALHSIDTSDHLAHYDKAVSRKLYLSVSESVWRHLFENEVQYINRMQRGDWLQLFNTNSFELIDEEDQQTKISELKLADRYSHMPKTDLECTVLRVLLKKRVVTGVSTRVQNPADLVKT